MNTEITRRNMEVREELIRRCEKDWYRSDVKANPNTILVTE